MFKPNRSGLLGNQLEKLAQLKSQSLLCLPRAEPPFGIITNGDIGYIRGSHASVNGHRAATRGKPAINVDITSLLKSADSNESKGYAQQSPRGHHFPPHPNPTIAAHGQQRRQFSPAALTATPPPPRSVVPISISGHRRGMPPQGSDQPVKKQSKWSPEEDALIIELRGSGMKWEDVSKRLPGRSAISCRLHYQNYLERRSEWDEERKNKLARLYERFKSEMWAKVAEELAVPWRAAEAMHWQLGEADMARRAGVVPFSLAAVNVESGNRSAPPRANMHYQAPDTTTRSRPMTPPSPRTLYSRHASVSSLPGQISRVDNVGAAPPLPPPPPPLPPPAGSGPMVHGSIAEHGEFYYSGTGLAPIQHQGQPRNPGPLPSLAELTTGVSPYTGPVDRPHSDHAAVNPGPKHALLMQNAPVYQQQHVDQARVAKRRASPEMMQREGSHRRRLG